MLKACCLSWVQWCYVTAWYCKSRLNQRSSKRTAVQKLQWLMMGLWGWQTSALWQKHRNYHQFSSFYFFFFSHKGLPLSILLLFTKKIISKGLPKDYERSQHFPKTCDVWLWSLQDIQEFSSFLHSVMLPVLFQKRQHLPSTSFTYPLKSISFLPPIGWNWCHSGEVWSTELLCFHQIKSSFAFPKKQKC